MKIDRKLLTAGIDGLNNMELEGMSPISTSGISQKKLEQEFLDIVESILNDEGQWEDEFPDDVIDCYNTLITEEDDDETSKEVEEEVVEEEVVEEEEVDLEVVNVEEDVVEEEIIDVESEVVEPVVVEKPKKTRRRGRPAKTKKVVEKITLPEPDAPLRPSKLLDPITVPENVPEVVPEKPEETVVETKPEPKVVPEIVKEIVKEIPVEFSSGNKNSTLSEVINEMDIAIIRMSAQLNFLKTNLEVVRKCV